VVGVLVVVAVVAWGLLYWDATRALPPPDW
jgi:hypothetical protein